jgi:hypothetical protein
VNEAIYCDMDLSKMYRLNFKTIPIGSFDVGVADDDFFFLSPNRLKVESFRGSKNNF